MAKNTNTGKNDSGKIDTGGTGQDFTGYGGLGDSQTPVESYTDFTGSRWPPRKENGKVRDLGNYFEIKRKDDGGNTVSLRPRRKTAARIYLHSPNNWNGSPRWRDIKLWVNEILIGFSMEYTQGQGVFGKTFYPRHIHYTDAIVRGQTASQAHYDEIVEMVAFSHQQALRGDPDVVRFHLPELSYARNTKGNRLYQSTTPGDPNYSKADFNMYAQLSFDGYITGISAGHKKGVFNPEFELRFAVVAYSADNTTSIKNLDVTSMVDDYRKSVENKSGTGNQDIVSHGAVFDSGYGPADNQGPHKRIKP